MLVQYNRSGFWCLFWFAWKFYPPLLPGIIWNVTMGEGNPTVRILGLFHWIRNHFLFFSGELWNHSSLCFFAHRNRFLLVLKTVLSVSCAISLQIWVITYERLSPSSTTCSFKLFSDNGRRSTLLHHFECSMDIGFIWPSLRENIWTTAFKSGDVNCPGGSRELSVTFSQDVSRFHEPNSMCEYWKGTMNYTC